MSTGSSSTGEPKKKVIINYAEHVRQSTTDGGVDQAQEAGVSERSHSQSNFSGGYNHAPDSDRHYSSTNIEAGKDTEWPLTATN